MFLYTFMILFIREDFLSPQMWVFLNLLLRIFRQPHLVFFREEEACAFLKNGITFIVPFIRVIIRVSHVHYKFLENTVKYI